MAENITVTYEQFRLRVEKLLIERNETHQLKDFLPTVKSYISITDYKKRRKRYPKNITFMLSGLPAECRGATAGMIMNQEDI